MNQKETTSESNGDNQKPALSVVVATFNRADTLRRTLEHLALQDLEARRFEVIVVDDGSPDHTGRVVEEARATVPFALSYLEHENRGPGYSQNRGIRAARAPIVLLIADDIWLFPGALREHLRLHLEHPNTEVCFLGKVIQSPELDETVFLRRWDPFRFNELKGLKELPAFRFGAANLSVKRLFLLENGLFRDERGRAGAAALEDLELGYRLKRHGLRLLYAENAWGHHYHPATLGEAASRWYERGCNYGAFRRFTGDPEVTIYFHVLNWRTLGEYYRVLHGPNSFRGSEASFTWHVIRHFLRVIVLNRFTSRWVWRPVFDLAEKSSVVASFMTAKLYRAFLYHQFLLGVASGRREFAD